ncbi:transposase [Streptomyces sp. NBC_01754]|uniref:transposase n=1 Tax=Streptomyces sp. NBC_01754 TaxID=2975930 RepID=UPI003FA34E9D
MSKRYTSESKRDAVALVSSSERNVTEVARELGVSAEGLRGWVKQAKTDALVTQPGLHSPGPIRPSIRLSTSTAELQSGRLTQRCQGGRRRPLA